MHLVKFLISENIHSKNSFQRQSICVAHNKTLSTLIKVCWMVSHFPIIIMASFITVNKNYPKGIAAAELPLSWHGMRIKRASLMPFLSEQLVIWLPLIFWMPTKALLSPINKSNRTTTTTQYGWALAFKGRLKYRLMSIAPFKVPIQSLLLYTVIRDNLHMTGLGKIILTKN